MAVMTLEEEANFAINHPSVVRWNIQYLGDNQWTIFGKKCPTDVAMHILCSLALSPWEERKPIVATLMIEHYVSKYIETDPKNLN